MRIKCEDNMTCGLIVENTAVIYHLAPWASLGAP